MDLRQLTTRELRKRYLRLLGAAGEGSDKGPARDGDPAHRDVQEVPQGSWLYIRYDQADQGVRKVPDGDAFWESPDILIDGQPVTAVVPGKPVIVSAVIRNGGAVKAFGTRVDFAFVDPSLGIPWSSPQPFAAGQKPTWISVPPIILGAGEALAVCTVPWVPPVGSPHACLLVMCSCPITGDMPTQPWNPSLDRHVGQHNVQIVAAKPGGTYHFTLKSTSTMPRAAELSIAAQASWVTARNSREAIGYSPQILRNAVWQLGAAKDLQTAQLLGTRMALLLAPKATVVGRTLDAAQTRQLVRVERTQMQGRLQEGSYVVPSANRRQLEPSAFAEIHAAQRVTSLQERSLDLAIEVPRQLPDGHSHLVVRVAQVEDGVTTGGYTFVLEMGTGPDETLSAQPPGNGANMSPTKAQSLSDLVVAQMPRARLTLEIAKALAPHLPLHSVADVRKGFPELEFNGVRIAEDHLPKELFPIVSADDLVRKVVGMLEIALARAGTQVLPAEIRAAIQKLVEPHASIPAGYLRGPSIFGSTKRST